MPKCLNNPKKSYKGTEPSPKGLGYCAGGMKFIKDQIGDPNKTKQIGDLINRLQNNEMMPCTHSECKWPLLPNDPSCPKCHAINENFQP